MPQRRMKQVVQPRRVLGDPQGNREQRRMAKKLDTKRSDGKERHDDPWSGQKVT